MTDKQIHKAIERNSGASIEESEKNGIMADRVDVDGLTADIQKLASDGNLASVSETLEMYKECFEEFIPTDKMDEANLFMSTYGSGLAKELAKGQR